MSAQLQQYSYEQDEMLADVRVQVGDNGEPWFVAKDVAVALGYSNPLDAVRKHCKGVREIRTPSTGGDQMMNFINEPDVYRLVMRSKMNEFINLCAKEKLPTIASNEWKEALRTSKRFVGIRTVNSGIKSQAVRCWLFTAEVSA